MNELLASAAPVQPDPELVPPQPGLDAGDGTEPVPAPPPAPRMAPLPRVVPISRLKVSFEKTTIESNADVDDYLDKMREALTAALLEGKRISFLFDHGHCGLGRFLKNAPHSLLPRFQFRARLEGL